MNPSIELTKTATGFVVSLGTSKIISSIIKNNTSANGVVDIVTIAAGTLVLGSMVGDISRKYTNHKIDEAVTWWSENVKSK